MMLLAFLLAASSATETPKAFMERVYASYRNADFTPFRHPELYFAPTLLAAIKEDARLARGEVGYVDGDPICQCQDAGGLRARVLRVTRQGPRRAVVEVILDFTDSTARRVRFSLARGGAGWRIADVSSSDERSLLHNIGASNRKLRLRH